MGQPERRRAVAQYKAEKKGFFQFEDGGPNLELLRDIGFEPSKAKPSDASAAEVSDTDVPGDGDLDGFSSDVDDLCFLCFFF